ncbi:hypothetical protein [Paraburkholderia antibiotica]|uniref:hypothetical protein n=1 Tax=Paraburkholderia antibiotica TaxID=2728839 RepID=UPI001E564AE1|nr:hypothetical protein [Paraburkholderia antibiotica]
MEKLKQENSGTDWSVHEECLLCRITYSIYSNFPPMPSARALNVEASEFSRIDRLRSLPTGYAMAEALGYAWACRCRGRSRTQPQNLGNAQPFGYKPSVSSAGDAEELAGTTNEKYARKMYGYDSATFRDMVHRFKRAFTVGAKQDLEFEENGDVYFNGEYLDNFHDYGD